MGGKPVPLRSPLVMKRTTGAPALFTSPALLYSTTHDTLTAQTGMGRVQTNSKPVGYDPTAIGDRYLRLFALWTVPDLVGRPDLVALQLNGLFTPLVDQHWVDRRLS